jgi:hypothetical protein
MPATKWRFARKRTIRGGKNLDFFLTKTMDRALLVGKIVLCEESTAGRESGSSESFLSRTRNRTGLFSVPAPPSYCQVSGGVFY